MYRLLREPTSLDDIDWKKYRQIVIWRDNATIICICKYAFAQYHEKNVCFKIKGLAGGRTLEGAIYGKDDTKIAETATFFWSLEHPGSSKACLETCVYGFDDERRFDFDFAALTADQLAKILDANPNRRFHFATGTWRPEISSVLATRPYCLNLTLTKSGTDAGGFTFTDEGSAFVNALEQRQSTFGSLYFKFHSEDMPFSSANIKRLLQLNIFEKLAPFILDKECVLLPFSTKVKTLEYQFDAQLVEPQDFDSLEIITKDLKVKMYLDNVFYVKDCCERLISFLNRVAQLGHLEKFTFSIDFGDEGYNDQYEFKRVKPIAEALIRAILCNPNLVYLDISDTIWIVDWAPHLQAIFKAMEGHKRLTTFIVRDYPPEADDEDSQHADYSWPEQLLARNKIINVFDISGKRCSDGSRIDQLYMANKSRRDSLHAVPEGIVSSASITSESQRALGTLPHPMPDAIVSQPVPDATLSQFRPEGTVRSASIPQERERRTRTTVKQESSSETEGANAQAVPEVVVSQPMPEAIVPSAIFPSESSPMIRRTVKRERSSGVEDAHQQATPDVIVSQPTSEGFVGSTSNSSEADQAGRTKRRGKRKRR